jgi:predicted TIM-barrel fold metal-dependent hydrolase
MANGARLARSFPDTIFVLEHAGMPEDISPRGWQLWREGMAVLAERRNVNVKLSGLGTFVHACREDVMGPIVREAVAMFGADRCFYGSNCPIEKLWTDYGTLYRTFRNTIAHLNEREQSAILHHTAARLYRV